VVVVEVSEEEDIFTILSHPVRRKILQTAFENSLVSIREMKSWGYSIGSIYHHLKIIDSYMTQNEHRQYILTEDGHDLCRWFLQSDGGAAKVQQIDAFGTTPHQIIDKLSRFTIPSLIVLLFLTLFSIVISQYSHIIIVGPMFYNGSNSILVINLIMLMLHAGIYGTLQVFLTLDFKKTLRIAYPLTIAGFLLAVIPVYIEVIVFSLIALPVPYTLWLILTIVNQLIFLVVTYALSIHVYNSDMKTSMLVVLGTMYIIQMVNIFLF